MVCGSRNMLLLILPAFVWAAASDSLPAPSVPNVKQGVLACYWETTYSYPELTSESIQTNLCNYIIYGTAKLDKTTWELTHDNITMDIDLGGFRNISEMKAQDPNLKVEISVNRNWRTPKEYFEMASDTAKRDTFIKSAVAFVTKHNFDGIHLHWGNPESRIDRDKARPKLTILLQELGTSLHLVNKILSIAVWSPLKWSIDENFEVENIYKEVDLVFLNVFHYYGNWFPKTGGFAPLYPGNVTVPDEKYLNVDSSLKHMLLRKAIPCKTVLVVTAKGSAFKLKNSTEHGIGAPSIENAVPSSFGEDPKYNEYCNKMEPKGDWARVWDKDRKVTYMYKGDGWLSYEDEQSVEAKVEYVQKQGLAGVAINNLAYDDFDGRCNSSNRFPIVRLVKEKMKNAQCCKGSGSSASTQSCGILLLLLLLLLLTTFITKV